MIKLGSKINYLYLLSIVIFCLLYFFYKPKPQLINFILKDEFSFIDSGNTVNDLIDFNPSDNRVNIGKNYFFRDKEHWYYINQLSFWRNDYLNLATIDKFSKNREFTIKILENKNNYAQVKYREGEIVYACIRSNGEFHYNIGLNNIISTTDFSYLRDIFVKNIKLG